MRNVARVVLVFGLLSLCGCATGPFSSRGAFPFNPDHAATKAQMDNFRDDSNRRTNRAVADPGGGNNSASNDYLTGSR